MKAIKTRMVPALHNALSILELITDSRSGLTLSELAEQSDLPKSSVHYLLVTLERCGYVHRGECTGRYMLGIKLFNMANSILSSLSLRQLIRPYLSGLRMRTGLTAHLAILEQNEAVLIARHETPQGAQLASWIGKRMDMHCTAVGKAILAYLPEAEVDTIIRKHGLARRNENTICTTWRLRKELDHVVETGYAIDNEEDELGVRCLGVPIIGADGRPFAGISVSGATREVSPQAFSRLSAELLQTANTIRRVGGIQESCAFNA